MALRPKCRRAARREYVDAVLWCEALQKGLGRQFVDSVDDAIRAICEAPQRCRFEYRDIQRIRVKLFPTGSFSE